MYQYYIGSILVACLGIELLVVINRLEKLENAHESYHLKNAKASMTVFSVSAPASISSKETRQKLQQYQNVHINGGDFNEDTGVFTCVTTGLYFFTVSFVKGRDIRDTIELAKCDIYKNDLKQLNLNMNPFDDELEFGNSAIMNSIVVKLDIGDIVYLGNCFSTKRFSKWISFIGFLLYPEI